MKFGLRVPSLKKKIASRTSLKRYVRHSLGLKAPRGMGVFTNPKRAVYNRIYNRTTMGIDEIGKPVRQQGTRRSTPRIEGVYIYRRISFWRWLLCLVMPPLAMIGIGFGKFLLVLLLTVLGWIPGVVAAFVFVRRYRLIMKAD